MTLKSKQLFQIWMATFKFLRSFRATLGCIAKQLLLNLLEKSIYAHSKSNSSGLIYTPACKSLGVNFLAKEHNAVPRTWFKLGPPDSEPIALTIRPPRLPYELTIGHMSMKFSSQGEHKTLSPRREVDPLTMGVGRGRRRGYYMNLSNVSLHLFSLVILLPCDLPNNVIITEVLVLIGTCANN